MPQTLESPTARPARSGFAAVVLIAGAVFVVHMLTNHRYGFHRDELQVVDDARHPAWGYVAYPPLTPAVARVALEIFGPSLAGLRLFTALAQSLIIVLAGLMTRDLGGGMHAQVVAAAMTAIAPVAMIQGALFQYVGFDYLWWVLIAWLVIRLIGSGDERLWIAIGATIGVGAMTRYTIAFFIAGLVAGVLLTDLRRHLRSPWLWAGVAVSLLIFLPNFLWQVRNDFVTLEFLGSIHARDVDIGRTDGFLIEQLFIPVNPFTIAWWVAGLGFYFFARDGRRYRAIGWMFVVCFALLAVAKGRSYYTAPAYPMLLPGGAVVWERMMLPRWRRPALALAAVAVAAGLAMTAALMLPVAPVNSRVWKIASGVHDNFVEEIGWPELVAQVAQVYNRLPPSERSRTAILAANYGQAGAINLYGPRHGLPQAISGVNSHWYRGYGSAPPETLIVLGASKERAEEVFTSCEMAGRITNRYGVENEESREPAAILVCRGHRQPWPQIWARLRSFG